MPIDRGSLLIPNEHPHAREAHRRRHPYDFSLIDFTPDPMQCEWCKGEGPTDQVRVADDDPHLCPWCVVESTNIHQAAEDALCASAEAAIN